MAQARAERFGSVFYRALGLIRSGACQYKDRPVWFDVYAAHPPLLEPIYNRRPMVPPERPLRQIFYEEDQHRAFVSFVLFQPVGPGSPLLYRLNAGPGQQHVFFRTYYKTIAASTESGSDSKVPPRLSAGGSGEAINLNDPVFTSHSQRFINKFKALADENPALEESELLTKTIDQLEREGLKLFTHELIQGLFTNQVEQGRGAHQRRPSLKQLGVNLAELTDQPSKQKDV